MKLNKIDFNKLAVFCQVVESGNYQRAAEVLHVTPSALSQTITSLEFQLGFSLFDRRGKKLVPTTKGLKVHKEFRFSQNHFFNSLTELSDNKEHISGLLRIGSYLEFAKSQLSPFLAEFLERFPRTQIKMVFDTPSRLQNLLSQGQLDLCFSIFPSKEAKSITSQKVYQEELVLISHHKLLSPSPSVEQILEAPLIDYYFHHQPIKRWIALHYQKRPKKIPARVYASTAEMVLSLVREGAGIGIVPLYLLSPNETSKSLRILRPTPRQLLDHIWLLENGTNESTRVQKTFNEELLRHLSLNSKR